jgi:HEAT repeat protein
VQNALARLSVDPRHIEAAELRRLALDNSASMQSRLDAATILTAMQEPDEEGIQNLLACEDPTVFIETLKSIRSFRVEWALRHLIRGAKAGEDPARRAVFAWTLAAYPASAETESVLLDLATNDSSPEVREHAIESLGEFHSDRAVKVLLHILVDGSAPERFWALFSLGTLADPVAADGIRGCLQDRTAISGLGTIAEEANWALAKIEGG